MSEELKPCPFCGHDANVFGVRGIVEVVCPNCQASTGPRLSAQHAIADWNRRADKAKVVAQVSLDEDKLRQLVDEAMKNVAVEYAQLVKDALKELEYCGERGEPMLALRCRELAGDMKEACDD